MDKAVFKLIVEKIDSKNAITTKKEIIIGNAVWFGILLMIIVFGNFPEKDFSLFFELLSHFQ